MKAASQQAWQEHGRRMLEETSRFIEWGLAHPDQVVWIPAKPVHSGGYPRQVADWFWATVLSEGRQGARRWREWLLCRPRIPPWQSR
jgi:hypothetical protein